MTRYEGNVTRAARRDVAFWLSAGGYLGWAGMA